MVCDSAGYPIRDYESGNIIEYCCGHGGRCRVEKAENPKGCYHSLEKVVCEPVKVSSWGKRLGGIVEVVKLLVNNSDGD